MNTMSPTDGSAVTTERLTFRVPPAFFELPVYESEEQVGQALMELAQDIYPQGTPELWFQYAATQLPVVAQMMDAGVSYAGFCLLDLDGRHSTATVTAALLESVPDGQKMTASSVAAELAGLGGDQAQVETVWLTAGEAVVRFTADVTTLPAELTDSGRAEDVEVGKIAVFLPLRKEAEMVLFELSTPCMQDWDLYSDLFFNIVNTIELNDTGTPAEPPVPPQPEDLPAGGPADASTGAHVPVQAQSVRDVFG
ncbi:MULTISPECIES: hypothetical protein [unclassified Streptomyces]|jgi:hypothetical protein|uniref:hypothetical protein n=1 Tax=unclassified Streptomyces TaxID=2593676 RepID=UPI001BB0946B|nr:MULTISPECIES: hypothetical protein [unclassified Streptomyces]MDH6453306.1 hypothetical protein [Streptomyces sp. SAI-119]MDH6496138.1 hypothetical protein [Streptomyces sp. SAI-149]QUC57016.1 hypothetical protein IOD14_09535 [Streptomyces sp. A2-16]GLP72766.1 hypothetical protein TUSST3_93820 [Streptomyces sp. TUS-ST3]